MASLLRRRKISSKASTSKQQEAITSSSSSSPPRWMYDVFLSFRGKDTRNNFTGHLYSALKLGGINAYLDNRELERGKSIEPTLWKAIEESRFSIIVFSRDYACSPWCLDELVKIIQCMEEKRHVPLPVFYDVDPSEVAEQTENYRKAFVKHEREFKGSPEKVRSWKDSLNKAAKLSGWDVRNRNESEIIRDIVRDISRKLSCTISRMSKGLVGIEPRIEQLRDFLEEGSKDIYFIGICGMGGLGKTTLAREVYDRIHSKFEGSCFLANVREVYVKRGAIPLQEQLLSETLMQEIRLWDDYKGIAEIQNRLRHKKVIVILDDVDKREQLEKLAAEREWFGPGSRIIITTRDKHLLTAHGVTRIYEAEKLKDDEALVLFSSKAFKQVQPMENYLVLSSRLVSYADGLPLALEVLGSSLHGRSIIEWESAINRLNERPDKDILDVLQISFDGLNEFEKNIFLDIACFFKGMKEDRVTRILDRCGFHAIIGIHVLIEKSLISVSQNELWMHDLLERMGREIVRHESPENLGGRSRLWGYKDISHALINITGTEKVESIFLDMPKTKEVDWNMEGFSKLSKLRLLKFRNVQLFQGPECLSNELRFLEWHAFPSISLPSSFHPYELVELDMSYSSIEQLWYGSKSLPNLKSINLSYSLYLSNTPDFTGTPNLEKLILEGCRNLSEVHPSISLHKNLEYVNLVDCESLRSLPSNLEMESLKRFTLNGCSRLDKFPDIAGNMNSLEMLLLDGTAVEELPSSICDFAGLVELSLKNCQSLERLPVHVSGLRSLQKLDLSGCVRLQNVPEDLGNVECLKELDASTTAIRELPESIFLSKNLQVLLLNGCEKIVLVWPSLSCLGSLTVLNLSDCNMREGVVPKNIGHLSTLRSVDLSRNNFRSLPRSINQLSMLETLLLEDCRMLQSLPEVPSNIQNVTFDGCTSLTQIPDPIVLSGLKRSEFKCLYCLELYDHNDRDYFGVAMLKRYLQGITNPRPGFSIVVPGSKISAWFIHQKEGSSINIEVPPNVDCDHSGWKGLATCVAFSPCEFPSSFEDCGSPSLFCHFKTNGRENYPSDMCISWNIIQISSDHLWFFCLSFDHLTEWQLDCVNNIELSFHSSVQGIKVKNCGVRLVCSYPPFGSTSTQASSVSIPASASVSSTRPSVSKDNMEAVLSVSLESLFGILTSQDFFNFIKKNGVDKDLKKWESKLLQIHAVLNDAEEKQLTNPAVKIWLTKLRDLAYDAEDILDEFHSEALQGKIKSAESQASTSTIHKLLPACWTAFKPSALRHNIKRLSKIHKITARLEDLVNDKDLELDTNAGVTYNTVNRRLPATSLVKERKIHGREKDKEAVLKLLMQAEMGDSPYSVIPIIGVGGIGKTTLAQLIYNDEMVESFDCKAWVCVSHDFDILKITKTILQHWENCKANDLNLLQEQLKEMLRGKKFFIVLDDVWNENHEFWTILRSPFASGAPGSKIIVTTRSEIVSLQMGSVPGHALEELPNDDCLSLLAQHSLYARNLNTNPHFKKIGQELVLKCQDLPLVAKTLGGLLRGSKSIKEWEVVLNSKMWDFSEEKSNILPALILSYQYLPSHLKQCFSFCAIFPKGYEFDGNELVLLWMAQGFLQQPGERKHAEDLGYEYFDDLLSRSFFQPSVRNKSRYVMHDLISDLAQLVGGGICFHLDHKPDDEKSHCNVRHSSFISHKYDIWERFKVFYEMKHLRTLLVLPGQTDCHISRKVLYDLVPKLYCLRALSLAEYSLVELPDSIGALKHLRYFDISGNPIEKLPQSLCKLFNLQTLLLRGCYKLVELPIDIGSLRNLQYFDIRGTSSLQMLPLHISELTNLRSLSKYIEGEGSGLGIGGLMKLSHLKGWLHVGGLHNGANMQDAKLANLKEKRALSELTLEWKERYDGSRNETEELQVLNLLWPHQGLEKLSIASYSGTVFPSWVGDSSFTKMVTLVLVNCRKITALPLFGKLPVLRDLRICGMDEVKEVVIEKFPSLETLIIEDMLGWEQWSHVIDEDVTEKFPKLRELQLRNCPKLMGKLPSSLPSIKELHLDRCQEVILLSAADLPSLTTFSISEISGLASLHGTLVQGLVALEDLKVEKCEELRYMWGAAADLNNLSNLKRLVISNCKQLVSLLEGEEGLLPCKLQILDNKKCYELEKLSNGLHRLSALQTLEIYRCPKLLSFPDGRGLPCTLKFLRIGCCDSLKSLPDGMMVTSYGNNSKYQCLLEKLQIHGCPSLKSFPQGKLPSTLKSLEIQNCASLESLPDGIVYCGGGEPSDMSSCCLSQLESLNIYSNSSLMSFPNGQFPPPLKHIRISASDSFPTGLQFPTFLETLTIHNSKMKSLPSLRSLFHLTRLRISYCDELESFPQGEFLPANLIELCIAGCGKLRHLPNSIDNLMSLQCLEIHFCRSLVSLTTSGFGLPPSLTSLDIRYCDGLKQRMPEWGLRTLTSLESLSVRGPCETTDVESFPDGGVLLPTSLTSLSIGDFNSLTAISKGIQYLASLENLRISCCPNLQFLPKECLPATLGYLYIDGCPLLSKRCKKEKGDYWPIIAHIPQVELFG